MKGVTTSLASEQALIKHLSASLHTTVQMSCPVCVDLVKQGFLVIGNDGHARTIDQHKAWRMSDGREPGAIINHVCYGGVGAHSDTGCGWDRVHAPHICEAH